MTLKSDVKESFKQEDFSKLVKKVLKIKRRGFTGLLALAEGVDVYLGAVVTNIVNMDVKFEDIKSMIGDLFISYRKETDIT